MLHSRSEASDYFWPANNSEWEEHRLDVQTTMRKVDVLDLESGHDAVTVTGSPQFELVSVDDHPY